MKNVFVKNNNNSVWLGVLIAAGAIAAGAITYLYFNNTTDDQEPDHVEENHSLDYLPENQPKKKHKSDLHDLHAIATH